MTRLEAATDPRYEHMRKLTEISRALTYTVEIDDVLALAAERAAELLSAERSLLMLSDDDGLLRVRAAHNVDAADIERFREPLDETLIRRLQGMLDASAPECFLGVPLVVHGRVTGLLAVARTQQIPCTEEDEWLLSAVADQVAVAVENARLQIEVRSEREGRARAMEGAGEAEQASERALATLSHDLRSPLNAIDSYSELMELEIFGPVSDRQREALGRIRMSGRHLLAVLENVLEMTRISAGIVRVKVAPVPAETVVREAVLMVEPAALSREQVVTVDEVPDVTLEADPDRLRQVLVNLLGNAVKYTPEGGSIGVTWMVEDWRGRSHAAIIVRDSGPGIPADKADVIFQPYYRLPETEATSQDGIGLGLAISRELIRQMGGEIEVDSETGGGSVFTIRLPITRAGPGQV